MLSSLLRFGEEMSVKRLGALTERINALRIPLERLTDAQLRAKTDEFRARIADHESLESLLPEAFAVAREAARRVLSLRPYDVQLMGGAALHFGNIAEMMTGEGKTLASVMPVYLNALSGKGVHVVTVNDYLARRDSEQMGRVYRFLGLEVGLIVADKTPEERRVAYRADITYGTNNEFGFDYLRDNMAHTLADTVQRGHNYAIVDEVDSILIDEARTPLIISGPADESSPWYPEFARLAALMKPGKHFDVDVRKRAVGVTEEAVALVEDQLGIDNLYDVANSTLVSHLNNAVKAKALFTCDKDYIVNDDLEVMIVDEFTGRVLFGRRYNAGLHQAIEAKEGVEVKPENQTLATITLQNYFRLYRKLAGMTGTAQTEAAEFYRTYRLGVVTIPANKPMIRVDKPDLVYRSELAKFDAVVADVVKRHATGQPILVGTTSVEKSEYLSRRLAECDVEHCVLNAKHLEEEATIVAQAGRRGAVTVATDMAGRGTDIVLGGNVDFLTDRRLREMGLDPVSTPEEYEVAWRLERPRIKRQAGIEAEEVAELGGLYVIGTERHESRRIDNQLRGRSGRQGDPGETRFYLSLGDELMRRFSGVNLEKLLARFQMSDNEPIRSTVVTRAIRNAQMRIEQQNFEVRKNVLDYDEVLDQQRRVIYTARRRVLKGDDLDPAVLRIIDEVVTAYVDAVTASNQPEEWDLDALWDALRTLYPVGIQEAPATHGKRSVADRRKRLTAAIIADARRAFAVRESEVDAAGGPNTMRELEREVVLNVIDQKWREHLYEMDYLKEGIGLRALAERNPVVEYRREGYEMFVAMIDALKEECVANIFRSQIDPDVVVSQDISDTNQEVDMLADSEA